MSGMDDREKAFENKFAHDAAMQFKADARCNKYLGLWLASRFGLSGDEAEAYAKTVIASDLEEAGHEDVVRKVMLDIAKYKVDVTEQTVREKLAEFRVQAKDELMKEAD